MAFTCPSCAISCYIICMLCKSHTEQIPFNCVVASMLGLSQFQSKLVTGDWCSAYTSYRTSHNNFPCLSATSQILTNSPDVARKSFLAEDSGAHIILEGGYSWGKSNSLTSRWVVWGCYGCSLLVVVASISCKISTLLFYYSMFKLPMARVISDSLPFWNAIEFILPWKVYLWMLSETYYCSEICSGCRLCAWFYCSWCCYDWSGTCWA